jgi:hypothetical protein
VRVLLLDADGAAATAWLFSDTVPAAYQLSPLNALGNEPVIETLELSVGGLEAYSAVSAAAKAHRTLKGG